MDENNILLLLYYSTDQFIKTMEIGKIAGIKYLKTLSVFDIYII